MTNVCIRIVKDMGKEHSNGARAIKPGLPLQFSEKLKTVNSAGIFVFRQNGGQDEVLMIRSLERWSFPKGHVEDGETYMEAAIREVFEETGIKARITSEKAYSTGSAFADEKRIITYYIGEYLSGSLRPQLSEVAGAGWQDADDAVSLLRFREDAAPYMEAYEDYKSLLLREKAMETAMTNTTTKTAALILAGGRSSRMGRNKAMIMFEGMTLLDRAIKFWQTALPEAQILVSAGTNRAFDELVPEGVTVVYDIYEMCGALAGIHSAFAATDADILYVSAIDMPFISRDILPSPGDADIICYERGGRPESLFGIYKRSCFEKASELLANDVHKMSALLDAMNTEIRHLTDADKVFLCNINTPATMAAFSTPPMVGFIGKSGTGKTTYIERIIPVLKEKGLRIAVIKHDVHDFEVDKPGKDTWRFREAGADAVSINNDRHGAIIFSTGSHYGIRNIVPQLPRVDLVIIEGYKSQKFPKIEIHRKGVTGDLICKEKDLLAVITDEPLDVNVPQLSFDDLEGCAQIMLKSAGLSS